MSVDVSKSAPSVTSVQGAFSDLRGANEDCAKFLGDAFDQLEALSLELFARHKCLELSARCQGQHEAAGADFEHRFQECLEELRELETGLRSAHEESARIWSDISQTHQQFLREHAQLHETQEEIRRIGVEFRAMRESIEQERAASRRNLESIQEHLQQLTSISAESAAVQSLTGHDDQLAQVLEATRQQQAAWQQDRAGLETELAAERQRAAQQNDALAEQRRLASEQQAELAGELKRMRSLMEMLLNNMKQPLDVGADEDNQTSSSSEHAALESVLAQFEMLQRDLAQRRSGWNKDAAKR